MAKATQPRQTRNIRKQQRRNALTLAASGVGSALGKLVAGTGQEQAMHTAHEFFIHELKDMLDAESELVEALGMQAQESTNRKLQQAFQSHQKQTQKQRERLQQVFEEVGESAAKAECKGIRGLIAEHDAFADEDPSDDLLDIFNAGAAIKVERYEISAYESLIQLAQMMKRRKAAQLLRQNLIEEQQTQKKMVALSKKLKPADMGMEEEEKPARKRNPSRRSTLAA